MRHRRAILAIMVAASAVGGVRASEPLTLQQCLERARSENVAIQRDRLSAEQARLSLDDARAARLPSVSASTSQSFTNRPFESSSYSVSGTQVVSTSHKNTYSGSYGVNAQMTLYDGGQMQANIRRQQLQTQIADLAVSSAIQTVEQSVTQAYVQILYAQETVAQDSVQVGLSEQTLERAKALKQAGLLNKADVAQLESQLAADRYQLVADRNTLADYLLQLKQLLELDGDASLSVADPALVADVLAPLPAKEEVYRAALLSRPEIRSQQLAINRADEDIRIAKAGRLPTITAQAALSTNNNSGQGTNMFTQLKNQWANSIGVNLSVPLYDRRKTSNAVARARLSKQDSELALVEAQKSLRKDIENYWLQAGSAQQRYLAAEVKRDAAATGYELTSEQFRLGMKNILELTTDKNALQTATQQLLQAKYMALLNRALLRYYGGVPITLE